MTSHKSLFCVWLLACPYIVATIKGYYDQPSSLNSAQKKIWYKFIEKKPNCATGMIFQKNYKGWKDQAFPIEGETRKNKKIMSQSYERSWF